MQRDLDSHVGHQSAHDTGHMLIAPHAIDSHEVQQLITVVETPCGIHHLQAVGITVESDAIVGMVGAHSPHQCVGMGCTDLVVDIETIGSTPNGQHFGPEFVEHLGRHLVGGTMGRVYHDLDTAQRQGMRNRALAKLNVAACCIVESAGLAQCGRISPLRWLIQRSFDREFPGIRQLGALRAEEFDAVVRIRVVAGTDHHPQARALRPRQVSHARCGQRPQQHDIHACRIEARLQRAFQHVARNAGVLANQHRRALFGLFQYTTDRMREAQHKVRGDGRLSNGAANAVGTKVFLSHVSRLYADIFCALSLAHVAATDFARPATTISPARAATGWLSQPPADPTPWRARL